VKIGRGQVRAGLGRPLSRAVALAALAFSGSSSTSRGAPVIFESGPGRFEISAADARAAQPIVAAASEAWQTLADPLGLPPVFSSPVYVRVLPPVPGNAREETAAECRLTIEPGGVVALRVDAAVSKMEMRRGLVRALLGRLAVWRHGARPSVNVLAWLETACEIEWRTQAEPAQRDALQQESAAWAPPAIAGLLHAGHEERDAPAWAAGAFWLMTFLRAEAVGGGEWREFLDRLLGGEDPEAALAASYPGRFANPAERELWWQTGWHHHRRRRALPLRDAAESRAIVADAARFVFMRHRREVAVSPEEWPELARSADGRAALRAHAEQLARELLTLHPFYRNAGLALGRLLAAAESGSPEALAAARVAFDADWRAGSELEAATARALDAAEARADRGL
jgi:hypothetical protein